MFVPVRMTYVRYLSFRFSPCDMYITVSCWCSGFIKCSNDNLLAYRYGEYALDVDDVLDGIS
jgi:hypothetical protein